MIKKLSIIFLTLTLCFIFIIPASAITYSKYSDIYKCDNENIQPLKTPGHDLIIHMFSSHIYNSFKEQNITPAEIDKDNSLVLSINKLQTGEFEVKMHIRTYTDSDNLTYGINIVTVTTDGTNIKISSVEKRT